jgi:hypothetical protein
LGKQKKKKNPAERLSSLSPKTPSLHYFITMRQPNPALPLAPFHNFNYVAQARIHHRRKAANGDAPITFATRGKE